MATFLDANIPMYMIGADDTKRERCEELVQALIVRRERLVTDAEVFQEILHRYTAIRRPEAIQPAFDALMNVVDEVLHVDLADVQEAKAILLSYPMLSARDALHASIMKRSRIKSLLSLDAGFDQLPFIQRIS